MFITEEESNNILKNPRNLANRIRNGRLISPEDVIREDIKDAEIFETEIHETATENGKSLHESGIQHREIKRPGNNRPWLSKQERTGIAADYAAKTGNQLQIRETQQEIAKKYGVAVSTVSDIVNNARRVENSPRSTDQAKVDAALDKVREAAIDKLMAGLGQLTTDKVSAHNAKDISVICANMSKVVKDTIPQEKAAQQINLVVYTPELRNEKSFEIIDV